MIKYLNPEMEFVAIETNDIILASNTGDDSGDGSGDITTGEDEI